MNSRVHPKYKTKHRITNWTTNDQALVKRSDVTFRISPDATEVVRANGASRSGWHHDYRG